MSITQVSDISEIVINNDKKLYDVQYGKVLNKLSEKSKIIKLQLLNNIDIIDKAESLGSDFIPYECFFIIKKVLKRKILNNDYKIENRLKELKNNKLNISNIYDPSSIFYDELLNNLESIYKGYAIEVESASILIKLLNIKKLIATNEADRARCFIAGGNKLGIPTFGIQHGIISNVSYAYFTPTNQKELVPKVTFLWGKSFQKLLLNTNVYTIENTKVVGQNRTDFLIDKLESYNNSEYKGKKILYATQPIEDLTHEATEILFEAIKGLDDVEVLIKLHPNEVNMSYYDEMVKKYNYKNVRVEKDIDLYEAIIWCDLIFTVHSTVVLDGAVLKKPSISCLLKKYNDQGDFVKNNISIGINNSEELRSTLIKNDLKLDYSLINNNIFSPDGNVYLRIIDVINSI